MESPMSLQEYIFTRIKGGMGRDAIKEQILAVGWSEEAFDAEYSTALIACGVPVPSASRAGHAKRASTGDVILNFFSFILMGIVVSALGTLYYGIIHVYFPDSIAFENGYDSYAFSRASATIHYAIAALVVAFPLHVLALRLWFKRFREDELKTESKLTKWITYLVLLVASVTIVGDLIYVLFQFLQGEITVRFLLKACTVLGIAGMVFGFYFLERKKIQYRVDIPRLVFQRFGYVCAGLVLIGIVLGFFASGGPSEERARTFDERRSTDLVGMVSCVTRYAELMDKLPDTLEDLRTYQETWYCTVEDAETGAPYEYKVLSPLVSNVQGLKVGTVELCATFSAPTDSRVSKPQTYGVMMGNVQYYTHGEGRTCFTQEIVVVQDEKTFIVPEYPPSYYQQ